MLLFQGGVKGLNSNASRYPARASAAPDHGRHVDRHGSLAWRIALAATPDGLGQRAAAVVPRVTRRGARTVSRGVVRPWSRRSTAAVTACRACSSAFWLTVVRSKQDSRDS